MGRLESKAVIVTGAGRGIAKGIAERIHAEGGSLVLIDRDHSVEAVAKALNCPFLIADVRDADAPAKAIELAQKAFGYVNGLVNNVGFVPDGDICETDEAMWNEAMDVNARAPFRWSQAAIPAMLDHGGGAIVNISTIEAVQVRPRHFAYVVSKSALNSLTRSIACDFGRQGIRCNTISPGSIKSELFDAYALRFPGVEEHLIGLNYAGRLGRIEEIAAACAYLLSDDTPFLNGQDMIIDGARTIAT